MHTGDFCDTGSASELDSFCAWLDRQPHAHKVVVAGNHDGCLDRLLVGQPAAEEATRRVKRSAHYLFDSGVVLCGLSFWGSPMQPDFEGAFNKARGAALRAHWDLVPSETDVLLTHTPPAGHLDIAFRAGSVGCGELGRAIERIRPLLNVFGHIHEGHGVEERMWVDSRGGETLFVNAASVDLSCSPSNAPVVVDLIARAPS